MGKNDYRRSLIMLRGLEKGYSGHARLERRVLSGTMDFVAAVPAAEETLSAALVGTRGGKTSAEALGILKNDGRGQRALLAGFDPRNIRGMDLNDISVAVISRIDEAGAAPVMYGYINGSRPLNWQDIHSALDALYNVNRVSSAADYEEAAYETEPVQEPEPTVSETQAVSETAPAAISLLPGIDPAKPWPSGIEALRILFLTMPSYEPFKKDGYVFVKAGMAEETGIDHCAVGVRAANGRIEEVCYAIPLPYTAEPPAGLEGYSWVGNTQSGWWITCDDVDEDDDDD